MAHNKLVYLFVCEFCLMPLSEKEKVFREFILYTLEGKS